MDRIAVVIPAYNEEAAIADVVRSVHAAAQETGLPLWPVVVNDCSKDSTADIIAGLECTALNLPVNLGIGGAVQTGYKYALRNDFTHGVQIDGDGQHPPVEIAKIYTHMQQQGLDVVIGSRFIEGSGFQSTFMRRLGIKYFKFLNRLLLGVTVYDNTSGMRLLGVKALELVNDYYPDEYPEPESLVFFVKNGLKVGERQVEMRERQGGVSSISGFGAVYYMFKVSLAIVFTHIRLSLKTK